MKIFGLSVSPYLCLEVIVRSKTEFKNVHSWLITLNKPNETEITRCRWFRKINILQYIIV